uniref:Protein DETOXIFICATION n=1 Tax=Ananas comosus var. bracteatus TaxID=296719 RepID=A0A6V7QN18_ANACO|nr:unnamed protein product [Ananas comosus var. bracteatus]
MCTHTVPGCAACSCGGGGIGLPLVEKPPPAPVLERKPRVALAAALAEVGQILGLALPMILTGLILYLRSMISMLFLGRISGLALAGGSLAIGFANITGYSVLSGLAMGMEPICGQAFGARRHAVLGLALQRTVLLLLCVSLPIAILWASMRPLLILCGQDEAIAAAAQSYILFSLPDLLLQSFLHPLRIFLRTQSINLPSPTARRSPSPSTYPSTTSSSPSSASASRASRWQLQGWGSLLSLAVPSCVSVCLEWWWYEIMILLCGLLSNPQATVASMGILIQTTSLIYIFPSSLSFGVSTRVGNELGANRPDRARRAATVGLGCSFGLGLVAFSFAVSVRSIWARMFTADEAIITLTASVLPILGACELGNCPQTTGCGVLRGSARPKVGANINLGAFYGVGMPVAVGLAFWAGLDFKGLWLGLLSAQAACVVLMLVVSRRTDWDSQAERAQLLTGAASRGDGIIGSSIAEGDEKAIAGKAAAEDDGDEKSKLAISIKIEHSMTLS